MLIISAGKLFCQACKETQPNLKESLKRHFETPKHKANIEKYKNVSAEASGVFTNLATYFEQHPDVQGVS